LKDKEMKRREEEKRRDTDVSWDYLESLEPVFLEMGGDKQLLYRLYVLPGSGTCCRNDFARMRLVDTLEEATDPNMNYYIRTLNRFIFREYKTASKFGQIEVDAPMELVRYIPENQDFMFELGGEPMTESALSKKCVRMFHDACKKHITLTSIRRSYANKMRNLPDGERRLKAMQMMHSSKVNSMYGNE